MELNHANLCTSDVAALSGIFTRHVGFEVEQANADFALLHGSDGFFLVLMKIEAESPRTYPESFHVGFMVETPAEVRVKHAERGARRDVNELLLSGGRRGRHRGQRPRLIDVGGARVSAAPAPSPSGGLP